MADRRSRSPTSSQPTISQISQPQSLSTLFGLPTRERKRGPGLEKRKLDPGVEPVLKPGPPPPLGELPSERPIPTRSDPASSARPLIVQKWEAEFEAHGRGALQEEFYKHAEQQLQTLGQRTHDSRSRENEIRSWEWLLQDREQATNYVVHLLDQLPNYIIRALLKGELPRAYRTDAEVRRYVDQYMKLDDTPGIYANFLHNVDGCWLSSDDVQKLIAIMEKYMVVEPDGEPRSDQRALDARFSKFTPQPGQSKLRWLPGKAGTVTRAETKIREWIALARDTYCNNPTDADTAFSMTPSEVGWSVNVVSRCKDHMTTAGTTYLFGLLSTICRSSRPRGFGFPDLMQIFLFPIWVRDERLCRTAEIVGSLLCGSYSYLGGTNIWHAGSMNWDPEGSKPDAELHPQPRHAIYWGENAKKVARRLLVTMPVDEDKKKARDLNRAITQCKRINELEVEMKDLGLKEGEQRTTHDKIEANIQALQSEIEDLQTKLSESLSLHGVIQVKGPQVQEHETRLRVLRKDLEEKEAPYNDMERY